MTTRAKKFQKQLFTKIKLVLSTIKRKKTKAFHVAKTSENCEEMGKRIRF